MQKKNLLFILLGGLAVVLGACFKTAEPIPFSTFSEYHFNDILTSLDFEQGDTLLLGTANGKVIFFNTNDATSKQEKVGDNRVYFVRQDTFPDGTPVTFVGVRNEGLKVFKGHQFSKPNSIIFGVKKHHYSVYKVERDGNWLICATSNGLAKLDLLDPDSLQALYPSIVQPDYKISAIQRIDDTLYASHDTLIHVIFFDNKKGSNSLLRTDTFPDIIRNLYVGTFGSTEKLIIIRKDSLVCKGMPSYENSLGVHSCLRNPSSDHRFLLMTDDRILMGNDLNPDSLTVYQLTLANEQYTPTANIIANTGYTYFISGSSLCQIPNHIPQEKHITAIADRDNSTLFAINDQNGVYSSKDNYHRKYVINRNFIKNEINQALFLNDTLCVLSGGDVFFHVDGRNEKSLKHLSSQFASNNITRMYWNSNKRRLFLSFREGYAYGEVTNGILDTDPTRLTYDSTLLSVQCFAQPDDSTLYIGTLNDGSVVRDLSRKKNIDTLFPYRTNITDILLCKDMKKLFVLTPMALYVDSLGVDNHGKEVHYDSLENIHNLYINRIHPLTYQDKTYIVGVSQIGGLYVFAQNGSRISLIDTLYPDILFYPDAIHIRDNEITAGSSLGLVKFNWGINDETPLKPINLKEPFFVRCGSFIKKHLQAVVNIGVPAAIILIFLVISLTIWSLYKKKIIKGLNKQNTELDKKNTNLSNKNTELGNQNAELNNQNTVLINRNTELSNKNTELSNQNAELNETKKQFEIGREVVRNNVLGNVLFKEERNIQNYPMTESINKLSDYQKFLYLKGSLMDMINKVEISQYNFYHEMQNCSKIVQEKLWEPSIRLDQLALRNWVIQYHQELFDMNSKYVSIFRKEINVLSEKIHEAISFSSRRDEETRAIYLKMWAAALLLHEPSLPEHSEDSIDPIKEFQKKQKEEQIIILKLMKPQYLYPLLFDEDKLSRTNFDRKKTNLLNDFEEMGSYKGAPYETLPVFTCENTFLIGALEKLRKY